MEELNISQSDNSEASPDQDSLLNRVLSETESQEKTAAKPFKLVNNILSGLRSRERDVLLARYGLTNDKAPKETLESIGHRFSVTRERVRQIENASLKKIGKKHINQLKPLLKLINGYLSNNGGVAEIESLAKHLDLGEGSAEAELDRRALRLIMGAYDKVTALKKYPLFKEGWASTNVAQDNLLKIQETIHQALAQVGQAQAEASLVAQISQKLPDTDPALIGGTLQIDPKVSLDHQGKWGLTAWPMVVPKRIRDKVFLALDETGQPLHFEKIAQLISAKYPTDKPVLSRTVHNELIGDKRFVLVGRGIYALQKWGYQPGVVSDVIKVALLKAGQPLTVAEIIAEVMKSRQVKKNTIIANLQNRQLFRKVAKSTYTLNTASPETTITPPVINI